MGASLQNRRNSQKRQVMSEINVTPFVDVMLVLLIIFMVAAPLMTSGVNVDLPKTASAPVSGDDKPLSVTITQDGKIYLQNTELKLEELAPKLVAVLGRKSDTRIFVRGDTNANYGQIMKVVSTINQAGFTKVAFLTETPAGQ
jgi:biopolymer transport protein TolR